VVAEKVIVVALDPGAVTTFEGENCTVKPDGNPVAVKLIAALKLEFGVVVSVRLLEAPVARLAEVADGVRENVGAGATVIESAFCCFTDPLVAETVTE
jgi:hypothetical protein